MDKNPVPVVKLSSMLASGQVQRDQAPAIDVLDHAVTQKRSLLKLVADNSARSFRMSYEDAAAKLDTVGADQILDSIAQGNLPQLIAYDLEIPQLHFMQWFTSNTTSEQRNMAAQACATMLNVYSLAVLQVPTDSNAQAAINRELSQRYQQLAMQIDSDNWNQAPSVTMPENSAAIQINIISSSGVNTGKVGPSTAKNMVDINIDGVEDAVILDNEPETPTESQEQGEQHLDVDDFGLLSAVKRFHDETLANNSGALAHMVQFESSDAASKARAEAISRGVAPDDLSAVRKYASVATVGPRSSTKPVQRPLDTVDIGDKNSNNNDKPEES